MKMCKGLILILISTLLLLGAIELGFRLFEGPADRFMATRPIARVAAKHKVLERSDGEGGKYLYSSAFPTRYYREIDDERWRYILADKTARVFRVFTFGGSSTAGSPFGHWGSFTRFIDDELKRIRRPGVTVEVLNFGLSGGRTHEAVALMQEVARYAPDLVIIYAGHNESCRLEDEAGPSTSRLIGDWLSGHSAAVRGLLLRLRPTFGGPPADPFGGFNCRNNKKKHRQALPAISARFQTNVAAIARLSRERGSMLLLSQLSNFFAQPLDFAVPPQYGGQSSADLHQSLLAAYREYRHGDARRLIVEIRGHEPDDPFASYVDGLLHLGVGDQRQAAKQLLQAMEHDFLPRRYRPSYSKLLTRVAASNKHVEFVDVLGLAQAELADELIDGRLIMDIMHPTLEGNRLIARLVLEEYFKKHRPRPDLLDYDALRPQRVYLPVEESKHYALICQRYYNLVNLEDCARKARADYLKQGGPAAISERRQNRRVWEILLFLGARNGDARLLQESRRIYPSRTLAAWEAAGIVNVAQ